MAVILDEATRAEYLAQSLASSRASLVVSALTGTVTCEVYDGFNVLRASGTMVAPWATSSGATITIGEVNASGLYVTSGGSPDSNWYAQFKSGTRFVRGTFGLVGSGADFLWSLESFTTGSRATLGTVTLTALGAEAPAVAAGAWPVFDSQYGGGPTYTYQHGLAQIPWDNAGGDWVDASGVNQGSTPWASVTDTSVAANHAVSINVTALMQTVYTNNIDAELYVKASGGTRYFASRQNATIAYRPTVSVTYVDATTATLQCVSDGNFNSSTAYSLSTQAEIQIGAFNGWLRFENPTKVVQSATLNLTATQSFGGTSTIQIFRLRNQTSKSIPVQTGIAAAYSLDSGLEANAAVVRRFNFQGAESTWKANVVGDINNPVNFDPNATPTDPTKLPLLEKGKWIGPGFTDYSNYEVVGDTYNQYGYQPLYPGQKSIHHWLNAGGNIAFTWEMFLWPLEPELYLRYYLRFGENFYDTTDRGDVLYGDLQMNGKFGPGFAHRAYAGNGGYGSTGTNGWSMRANFTPLANSADPKWKQVVLGDYIYSVDYYQENLNWGRGGLGALERNRWYCVERYMKLNTPGVRDGISRAWIDGKLAYEKTDHIWRTDPPYFAGDSSKRRVYGDMGIASIWWDWYNGGVQPAPNRADAFISDVVVSRSYVGPMGGATVTTVPSWVPAAGDTVAYSSGGGVLTNTWRSISDPTGIGYDPFYSAKVTDYSATFLAPDWRTHGGAVIWGGGHSGTNYNGVTILTFAQNSMSFECLQTPTPWTGGLDVGNNLGQINAYGEATVGPSGRLAGPHSYGSGDVVNGAFVQVYNQAYGYQNTGEAAQAIHALDLNPATSATARQWARRTNTLGALAGMTSPTHTRYVAAQNRIYFMRRGGGATMAWVDLTTNTYVNGTGADFGYNNSDTSGGDPISGGLVYVASRDLLIGAYSLGGNLRIEYANVAAGVSQPTVVAAALSQTLAVPANWGAICWCQDNNRLLLFGIDPTRVYEITIPASLGASWAVDYHTLPGGKTIVSPNRSAWAKSFDYNPKTKAVVWLALNPSGNPHLSQSGNDVVQVYRPRNT